MALSAKILRKQVALLKPFVDGCSIQTCRLGQKKMGELMAFQHRADVSFSNINFSNFEACWVTPKEEQKPNGVVLYLHGGGYVAGDLEYSKGFGSILASRCKIKVLCAAYRLAPEYKFPAPIDDALIAYRYLLRSGYSGSQIMLAGESAGGGLIYALALKLRELHLPMPCGFIAMSPWTDLTMSSESFEINKDNDPSLTKERLEHYAVMYTDEDNLKNPYVSPLFGDLHGLPKSLIFVGEDEILLNDSTLLHEKLLAAGNQSELITAPGMWHAYVLFNMKEREQDYDTIDRFIKENIKETKRSPKWMRLDNAAKIYPAAMKKNWTNVFRISATLKDKIDPDILQSALEVTIRRFPSVAVGLKKGVFWYYLEQISHAPSVEPDTPYPTTRMSKKDISKCAFRVFYYENRIAVEFFHALTDGSGALIFVKSLTAEYVEQKYGITVTASDGVLDRDEAPSEKELEDSFIKYSGDISYSRDNSAAYHLQGTKDPDGFKTVVCFMFKVDDVLALARKYNATITALFASVLISVIADMQNETTPHKKKQKPVRVLIPVNLRKFYPSDTLRNFAYFALPGIDPRIGDYSFEEIVKSTQLQMNLSFDDKQLKSKFAANVKSEKSFILRIMPLFIKNIAMKIVYSFVGEKTSCIVLSNLGQVKLPSEMADIVTRMDFVLGVQATCPSNCGMISYKDKLYLNFIRDTKESELEYRFFKKVQELGLSATVESNQRPISKHTH